MANDFVILLPAATRSATTTSATQTNTDFRGLHLFIAMDTPPGAPPIVTPFIEGLGVLTESGGEPDDTVPYALLQGPVLTGQGLTVLKLYPGIVPLPSGSASDILPYQWQVRMVHGNSEDIDYVVSASLVM